MRRHLPNRLFVPLLLAAGVAFAIYLLVVTRASNCGGNSAALVACAAYVANLERWRERQPQLSPFDTGLATEQKLQLFDLPGANWLGNAHLLANPAIQSIDSVGKREIALVCDKPYRNVPRYTAWIAAGRHAVAYSTGETGLISGEEFVQLDRREFVDLRRLYDAEEPSPQNLLDAVAPAGSQ
jgi:hypothetical protein